LDVAGVGAKRLLRQMRKLARVCAISAAALVAGCSYGGGGGELGETGQIQVVASSNLPEPSVSDILGQRRSYVVGPRDVLVIDVFGIEELTAREIVVDNAGRLALPIAGSVEAAGKTPEELAALITERLRARYVRDPLVSVNVKDAVSQVFTLDGQIARPGLYPVLGDMTLMRAIASGQGLGEFAQQDDVVVFRTVGGLEYAGVYNIAAIRRGNYPDPQIYANDVVIVGDSSQLRRMRDIIDVLPAVVAPVIYILSGTR
jgi:polysaccharide export outer membrane protein